MDEPKEIVLRVIVTLTDAQLDELVSAIQAKMETMGLHGSFGSWLLAIDKTFTEASDGNNI